MFKVVSIHAYRNGKGRSNFADNLTAIILGKSRWRSHDNYYRSYFESTSTMVKTFSIEDTAMILIDH